MVAKLKNRAVLATAAAVFLGIGGCMKAGDGVGLTEKGEILVRTVCEVNPLDPSCQPDPCIANPGGPGCPPIDSCKLAVKPPRCIDTCAVNPALCKPSGVDCTTLPKPVECLDRAYFTAEILPIFKAKCELCHKPNGQAWPTTKLSLESAVAWDSLVNVASVEMAFIKKPMKRVNPGMPDSSFLFLKVSMAKPPYGLQMPMSAAPLLPAEIEKIRIWITGKP